MNLEEFRRAVDACPDIGPILGDLDALYRHAGLPAEAAMSRARVADALYRKIPLAFTSGHGRVAQRCRELLEEIIHRHVLNGDPIDPYAPPPQPEPLGPIQRIFDADRFFAVTGARIVHGGQEAYYRPSTDTIHMPDEALFTGTTTMTRSEAYFAVLGHEHIHWTGHGSRLDRNLKRFGKAERAAEELVAEIGSAFLCAELGITQDVRPDHAQYLASWLQLLKDDPKAIFAAAARASEAVSYLNGLQHPGPHTDRAAMAAGRGAPAEAAMAVSAGRP
jgi:hypothetical protein